MTRKTLILGALVAALVGGTPALAQMQSGSMMSGSHAKMSKSQMAMMHRCQKMSHRMMMRNRSCMAMMKKHPGMMHSGNM